MLLQTHSYLVPKEKRAEHARLLARFRQMLLRLGCDHFEAYEQVGTDWDTNNTSGRFIQIMRFRDRRHQQHVQQQERTDPGAQALVQEFCELINFEYQQSQGLFVVGYYNGVTPISSLSKEAVAEWDAAAAAAAGAETAETAAETAKTDAAGTTPSDAVPAAPDQPVNPQ